MNVQLINKEKLLKDVEVASKMNREKFIQKNLSQYLESKIFILSEFSGVHSSIQKLKVVKKKFEDVSRLIDFEIIHAKRIVSSSEEKTSKKVLSSLTTKYFNNTTINAPDRFEEINELIEKMDEQLESNYASFFEDFLGNAKSFLNLNELKIISNLRANEIINDSSEVIYGNSNDQLPEYLNGLGYMNILYLLLNIDIKKRSFTSETNKKSIKLLFIEEPEAHTHPQLQYIFARKIKEIVQDIEGLQTIITSHSPHIVTNHDFENIRYMLVESDGAYKNVTIKNFHQELAAKYSAENTATNNGPSKEFEFLKQYLSIESGELFFADKVIFIEGISESLLMPYFISEYDRVMLKKEAEALKNEQEASQEQKAPYIPLASQNVSIIEVGANAKAFRHFIELLGIPTLIITDIDTTQLTITQSKRHVYKACAVQDNPNSTSNATIKYYFNAPSMDDRQEFSNWLTELINYTLDDASQYVKVAYQKESNGYHPRSFEDAFIHANFNKLQSNIDSLRGLKNKSLFEASDGSDIYNLTNDIIDKKSDFASSILFLILAERERGEWHVPNYIWEGLAWLQQQ